MQKCLHVKVALHAKAYLYAYLTAITTVWCTENWINRTLIKIEHTKTTNFICFTHVYFKQKKKEVKQKFLLDQT